MKPNIILQAPIFSLSGYGSHARDISLSLFYSDKYNLFIIPTGWGDTSITNNISQDVINILNTCCNNRLHQGDVFTFIHLGIPTEFKKIGSVNIGITASLESTKIPISWVEGCNIMDAVIVPSIFERDLFLNEGVKVPIYVVGEGVDKEIFNPEVKSDISIPFSTSFNFISGGQWMNQPIGEDRKGIGLLIQLFCELFENNKEVGLVLKTFSTNVSSPDFFYVKERINQIKQGKPYPKIYLIHGDLSDSEMAQLYCHPSIKAFVSLTSGEGFGRMPLEAAFCDLPIIITGWSGHMDYIVKDKANIVKYELGEVPRSVWSQGIFEPGMQWAIVDRNDAKRKIKRCYEGYSIAKERAVEMGKIVREKWNKDEISKQFISVIDSIISSKSSSLITDQPSLIKLEQI